MRRVGDMMLRVYCTYNIQKGDVAIVLVYVMYIQCWSACRKTYLGNIIVSFDIHAVPERKM